MILKMMIAATIATFAELASLLRPGKITLASAMNAVQTKTPSMPNSTSGRRVYLAGKIRGVPNYKARFKFAADKLRSEGWKVFNPVEQDEAFDLAGVPADIRIYLKHDIAFICDFGDVVALLDDWKLSAGAQAEYWTAKAIGIKTWELPSEYHLS